MSTTGDNQSTKAAQDLANALEATGQLIAAPVENGCAVKVETRAKRHGDGQQPIAVTTVWLPDPAVCDAYVWSLHTDYEEASYTGLDDLVSIVKATMLGNAL